MITVSDFYGEGKKFDSKKETLIQKQKLKKINYLHFIKLNEF